MNIDSLSDLLLTTLNPSQSQKMKRPVQKPSKKAAAQDLWQQL